MRSPGSGAGEAEGGKPAGSAAAPGNGAQPRLFAGPRDLAATAAKYMYNFREAEATDVSIKRPRLVHSASHVSAEPLRMPSPGSLFYLLEFLGG